jgi:NADH:ubiquinone oxidoreductase subunit 6 (subunit J)
MAEQHHEPFRGTQAPGTDATDEEELQAARIANRFDIRRIIGGVFLLYALILIVTGIVGSEEVKNKAAGINVDLWTGLAMLVVGALMIFWALSRPVAPEPAQTRGRGSGRIKRSPAT